MSRPKRKNKVTVSLSEPLAFPVESIDIALPAKPTYKFRITYEICASIIHTANCLLDSGAGVSLISSLVIPRRRSSRSKRQNVPQQGTATKQRLPLNRLIFLHVRRGKPSARSWYGVAPRLAVQILLGTSSIDRFIPGISFWNLK